MKKAIIVVGLGFGDEGKGSVVDWLCQHNQAPAADLVVRYNGGCQAAHNVVLHTGKHHTFAQFGSGTLQGARTHLSRFMLIDPLAFQNESAALMLQHKITSPYAFVSVERDCLVTTPFHRAANRLIESARGERRHGSCGMGIGLTRQFALLRPDDALYIRDFLDKDVLWHKLELIREAMREAVHAAGASERTDPTTYAALYQPWVLRECFEEYPQFARKLDIVDETWLPKRIHEGSGTVIFEGAQGVLLDERRGFHPHNTWTNTTTANAWSLLQDTQAETLTWGITRAFHTRHGAGPLPTEDPRFGALVADDHNQWGPWQQNFRAGALDMVLLRYALTVQPVDALFISHLDKVAKFPEPDLPICVSYERAHTGQADATLYDHKVFLSPPDLSQAATGEYEAQARVGEVLAHDVKPVYAHTQSRDAELADLICELASLGLSGKRPYNTGISRGPAAKDKSWR